MSEEGKKESFLRLADDFIKEKRYGDAIVLYRKLVDMYPGENSLLLSLAWAYHDNGMLDDAVDCFERLLSLELQEEVFTGFAYDELVRIYKEKSDYGRLVSVCEQVAAAQPDDIGILGELGDAYLRAGRFDDSVGVFEKMAVMEPDASAVFCSLGNALIASGNLDAAEEAYRKAVEIDPSEAASYFSRMAYVYFDAGHVERAEMAFRKCLEFRDDESIYYCGLGDVLISQGRLVEAECAYERATELNQSSAGVYYNRLGNTLARANYHLQAIETFKKAIAADSRNPFYYVHLAESYVAVGLSDMAEKMYRQAEALK